MYKKTLLSLAVASSVALTGCFEDAETGTNAGSRAKIEDSQFEGKTWPVFNPVTSELPVPNDLIFDSEAGDGSLSASIPPGEEDNPVLNALNNLSGASTVAPAVIQFNGKIDETTVDSQAFLPASDPRNTTGGPIPNPFQNVFLLETEYPSEEPVRGLTNQEPPTLPVALTANLANGASLTAAEREAVSDLIGTDLEPLTDTQRQQAAGGYLVDIAGTPRFDHDVVELDGNSALRIRPNQPLDPLKRYIVVVTDEVKDENGDPISASPSYAELTDNDGESLGSALNSVRSLVNNLWEASATSYFAVNNGSREAGGLDPLSADDIALTYSFTTSEDEKVLSHIAEPANWIADQVERSVRTGAADAAVEGGAEGFGNVRAAVNQAVAGFTPSEDLSNDQLAVCDSDADSNTTGFQAPLGPNNSIITLPDQFQCVGLAVKSSLTSNNAGFPIPSARNYDLNAPQDALAVSSTLSQVVGSGEINVHQGSINLPYYLGTPDAESGAPIRTSSWSPDSGLAAVVAEATGFPIPQADPDTSSVLNYNFPFPEKEADIDVPLLAITPDDLAQAELTNGDGDITAIIYQHGITTDRSAALAFGSKLVQAYDANVNNQVVVFAIDQPLHGVDPASTEERTELAGQLLAAVNSSLNTEQNRTWVVEGETTELANNTPLTAQQAAGLVGTVERGGSTIPGLAPSYEQSGINSEGVTERHFGYTANAASQPVKMSFDPGDAVGSSGSLFINLTNFLNGRDNLRQGALDLMNLRATVGGLSGVDSSSIYFVGHSLGTQNGGVFAGAVKQAANESGLPTGLGLAGVHLQTPVAGVVRLLENSPSFAPDILGGLQAASGLSQGDADLETYLNVNQHALDSADPINFASELANSNTLISQVNGDRTTPNAADDRFSANIEGVTGYDGGPLNLTTPNGLAIDSFEAPLTGSEALASLMEAGNTGVSGQGTPAITRYLVGTHGTPVLPRAETAEAPRDENGDGVLEFDVLKNREVAQSEQTIVDSTQASGVFGEMVTQTLQLMTTGSPATITGGTQAGSVIQND